VIKDNKDGTISVQYNPSEKGLHEMAIYLDDEHISGMITFLFEGGLPLFSELL